MGRTVPSFRIAAEIERTRWKQFRSFLDKKDRKMFDQMYDYYKLHMDSPPLRELVDAYGLDVMRLQPPDPVPGWLVLYQEGIFTLFEHSPSGHKPVLLDQIKEFRQLTNDFEKAVSY